MARSKTPMTINKIEGWLTMDELICCLCENLIPIVNGWGQGNNAQPIMDGRCCDPCDDTYVLFARLINAGYSNSQSADIVDTLGGFKRWQSQPTP